MANTLVNSNNQFEGKYIMNKIDLNQRTAIVTGGAKGIGYAITERLIKSGANVMVWDIDSERLNETEGLLRTHGKILVETVDVTDLAAISSASKKSLEILGKIDILINNAGAVGTLAPVWEQPLENWERMLRLNLTSAFMCCQKIVPYMIESGYGRIVNIASTRKILGYINKEDWFAQTEAQKKTYKIKAGA